MVMSVLQRYKLFHFKFFLKFEIFSNFKIKLDKIFP